MKEFLGTHFPDQKLADLHMHTKRSDGRATPQQIVDLVATTGQLHTLAITDHEVIAGAEEAKNYCLKMGYALDVIVGAELTTSQGHLLALDIQHDIPSGKPVDWTIEQIHKQGGLAIAAHPLYVWTRSLKENTIQAVIESKDEEVYFDAFEVYNAGVGDNPFTKANQTAREFYRLHADKLGAAIGCTDGHFYTAGRGLTGFAGDLRTAIQERQTTVLFLEQHEQLQLLEVAAQLWGSMVLEPTRRIQRYARRQWKSY